MIDLILQTHTHSTYHHMFSSVHLLHSSSFYIDRKVLASELCKYVAWALHHVNVCLCMDAQYIQ